MSDNDLTSRTPGPLGTDAPDPEIDDAALPLDDHGDDSIAQSVKDIEDRDDDQPQSNNADDVGEDENVTR